MKKAQETVGSRDIDEFENDIHLWNIISGGTGKGLMLLKKVVDATFADTKKCCMPRILIVGGENTGPCFHARVLAHSFCIPDIRELPSKYVNAGSFNSREYYSSNGLESAHLILDADEMGLAIEADLWQYLQNGWQIFSNQFEPNESPSIIACNGLMVLTVSNLSKLSKQIIDAMDFIVKLEPYSVQQLELITFQRLKYCGIGYEDEMVLKEIVKNGDNKIENVISFLKICLVILKADMRDEITLKDIELAAKLK